MKYLLVLLLLVLGCEDHKRPQRHKDRVEAGVIRDTVVVVEPCDDDEVSPAPGEMAEIKFPSYIGIIIDKKYIDVFGNLMDAANANLEDTTLQKELWTRIAKVYPEVLSDDSWTLYKVNGDFMYIKQGTKDDSEN